MADRYWVGGTGTWNGTNTTNWSASDGGPGGASVPATTGVDNVFFTANSNVGTDPFTVTIATTGAVCRDLTISGLDGAMTLAGTTGMSIRGSMTLPSSNFTWSNTGGLAFIGTSSYGSNKTITTGGVSISSATIEFNNTLATSTPSNSLVLQDAFNASQSAITLSAGTLDLNGYTLTCLSFNANNSLTRSIAFGSTGIITLTGTGTVWTTATITGFSYTGTSNIRLTNSSATARTISPGAQTAAQALNYYITAGTGTLSITTGTALGSLDFTGFSGTYAQGTASFTLRGDLTFSSTMSTSTSSGVLTLGATSGSRTITTAGITLNITITLNGPGATYTLADNFTTNSARNFTFTAGTLNINSKTTSLGILIFTTGTKSYTNGTLTAASVTHTSGDISIGTGYNVTCSGTYTLTAGTVIVNDAVDFTVGAFVSTGSNSRGLTFNDRGRVILTGSGTAWNTATFTAFTLFYVGDGTAPRLQIISTYAGSAAMTVSNGSGGVGLNTDWKFTAGTYTLSLSSSTHYGSLDFTGFSGTLAQSSNTVSLYRDITFSSTMTTSTTTGVYNMLGAATITTNGITMAQGFNFNALDETFVLADNFTQTSTARFSITNGIVNFNNKTYTLGILTFVDGTKSWINYGTTLSGASIVHTSGTVTLGSGAMIATAGSYTFTAGTIIINNDVNLSVGSFVSSNTNTRAIQFGAAGTITTNSTGTVWNVTGATGLSFTGTSNIIINNNTATAITVTNTATAASAMSFDFINGTYTLSLTTGNSYRNLDFTGFSGTVAFVSTTHTMYGNLTLGTSTTTSATPSISNLTWNSTSGTRTITSNGRTANFGIIINGVGQTLQLADAFVQGSTNPFGYANGTLDLASYSALFGVFTITTGTHAIINGTANCASVTHTSGNLAIGTGYGIICIGTYTFSAGSLTINNDLDLTCGAFTSFISSTRSIAFGTSGSITVNRSSGGSIFEFGGTNFTYTGSGRINISTTTVNSTSIALSAFTVAAACLSFYITTGSYPFTINPAYSSADIKNLDFTGFSGTYAQSNIFHGLYGDLTFSPTMTSTTTTGTLVFINTNSAVIRSNGHISGIRIQVCGPVTLADAYTSNVSTGFSVGTNGTTRNGNFSTGDYNLTLQSFVSNGSRPLTVSLGSSNVTITGSGSAWSIQSATTINAGTSTISMTSASAKTFAGFSRTYYKLNQGGSGALTVTGANSFNDITATTRPSTVTLPSATTTTVSNFTLSGTAGNLVTLNSSTNGSAATLSKSSGTVTVSYLSIKDSAATGGATWRAPSNLGNVDVSGNSGWNFASLVVAAAIGAFFAFF